MWRLAEAGARIDYILVEEFMDILDKGEGEVKEGRLQGWRDFRTDIQGSYDLILGGYIGDYVDRTAAFNARCSVLLRGGIKLWPHPASLVLHSSKTVMEVLLAKTILAAGGIVVNRIVVVSKEDAIWHLKEGMVIRRNNSCEGKSVFLPAIDNPDPAVFEETLRKLDESWDETERVKAQGGLYAKKSLVYGAYPYNVALRSLGECRVYFVFGKIVDVKHTVPSNNDESNLSVTPSYGRLNAVETIKQAIR